jgi:hypothetical protein
LEIILSKTVFNEHTFWMQVEGSAKIYAKNKFGIELANQPIYYDDICLHSISYY